MISSSWRIGTLLFLVLVVQGCGSGDLMPLEVGGKKFLVEIADDDYERQRGLMFREKLDSDRGMLFVFDQPRILSFWMRNTRIPLDIAYLDAEGRIVDILPLEPFNETPVPSSAPALYALEVNRGALAGLRPGMSVNLSRLKDHRKNR